MVSCLVKFTLFLLPLIFWPNPLKFELPKMAFFLGMSFFFVLWFFKKANFQKIGKNLNKTWFLWTGVLLLSTILNQRFVPGLIGDGYRHQGIIFFLALGVWAVTFNLLKKTDLKIVWRWISLGVVTESLIVLGQSLTGKTILGTFGEPNAVAGFLVLGLPILVRSFPFPFLLLPTAAIILTGSKAGLGALLAEGLIFSYFKFRTFPGKKFLIILGLVLVLLVGILGVYQEKNISFFENRWLIWNLGIKASLEKPILGYGAEGIIGVYEKQFKNINLSLEELAIDRSHNLFLDIVLFSGFLGLAVFLKWFWESARRIKENWQLAGLTGFLVFSFFQPIGVVHWVYLVFLLFANS